MINHFPAIVPKAGLGKHTLVTIMEHKDYQFGALITSIVLPLLYAGALITSKLAILSLFLGICRCP